MLDHMTMPVLFIIVIAVLAVLALGTYLVVRIVGERIRTREEQSGRRREL